jgi:Domain of unknown function (DUF4157)
MMLFENPQTRRTPLTPRRQKAANLRAGGLQAKLKVSGESDPLEQEADRVADRVLLGYPLGPMSSGAPVPQRKCGGCERGDGGLDAAASVVSGAGRPLAPAERAFFEPRFGRDFSQVRVHDDARAHAAAEGIDARAFTLGSHIAFGRGEHQPGSQSGRHLLAHELAHVVQQAARSGDGREVIHRRRIEVQGRVFEVGDSRVANRAAQNDILHNRVLFPGSDQAHIMVSGDRLGYEVSHTDPEDPFRWAKFKDIVDNGHVDIMAVSMTDTFPTQIIENGQARQQDINLFAVGGSGITLVRESLLRQVSPSEPTFTTSADSSRDKIFYVARGPTGNALMSNALAHELFGHYWLALQGVPFLHPPSGVEALRSARESGRTMTGEEMRAAVGRHQRLGVLTEAHGIQGPYGEVFTGTVRDYIERFAGAESGRVESPTRRVSEAHLMAELQALHDELLRPGGLVLQPSGAGEMNAAAARHWAFVATNYEILRHIPAPVPGAMGQPGMLSEGVRDVIVWWFEERFNDDQRRAFENVMGAARSTFLSGMPPNLAQDVLAEIRSRRQP